MKIIALIGELEVITGLHIGAGDDTMKIGGIDNPVIKDVNTNQPYIPGSSIKGKMRSLLEWDLGLVGIGDGNPFKPSLLSDTAFEDEAKKAKAENLIRVFGSSADDEGVAYGITRLSVGDCRLSPQSSNMTLIESKYENSIDRKSGTAKHPRQSERVAAGVKFEYDIRLKILSNDDEEAMKEMVKRGLELIESDYLGGNGSRGYGRVSFNNKDRWKEL